MAIPQWRKKNFNTLVEAGKENNLALMECKDSKTGKTVYAICAVYMDEQEQCNFVPLAKLFDGNPYTEITPPTPED